MIQRLSIGETLRAAATALSALPDSSPRLEAELLLSQASGWSRSHLFAWPERELDPATAADFHALLDRRLRGEPIAYLRGRQSFWTLELKVSPATLIPRPETERLVETALERLVPSAPLRVADLGTGSGAIAAALASERPDWRLIATDRSAPALRIARDNFRALGLGGIDTLRADWLSAFGSGHLDAILSNPPYIPDTDPHLARGDLRFEPPSALASGNDGLAAIRAIIADARRCLRPDGLLAIEHGFDQAREVRRLFRAGGLDRIETRQDLAGQDRVTLGYRPRETGQESVVSNGNGDERPGLCQKIDSTLRGYAVHVELWDPEGGDPFIAGRGLQPRPKRLEPEDLTQPSRVVETCSRCASWPSIPPRVRPISAPSNPS